MHLWGRAFLIGAVAVFGAEAVFASPCSNVLRSALFSSDSTAIKEKFSSLKELRVFVWNLRDLALPGLDVPRDVDYKTKREVMAIAEAIRNSKAQIVLLSEVANEHSARRLVDEFLDGRFNVLLIPAGDRLRHNLVVLVEKELPMTWTYRSNAHKTWRDPTISAVASTEHHLDVQVPVFARDFVALELRAPGALESEAPLFTVFGGHFKSPQSRGPDHKSQNVRSAEYEAAAEIILEHRLKYGVRTPVIVAGDFNGSLIRDPIVVNFWRRLGLLNAFDVAADDNIPPHLRQTVAVYDHAILYSQFDGALVGGDMVRGVRTAEVLVPLSSDLRCFARPRTAAEFCRFPSDHLPVLVNLDFVTIRKLWETRQH